MTLDSSLFGDDEPAAPVAPPTAQHLAADWQVKQMREALDRQGLKSMEDRQRLVEELLGRPVASLRELTPVEARSIGEELAARKVTAPASGSGWDDREEATWIDKL